MERVSRRSACPMFLDCLYPGKQRGAVRSIGRLEAAGKARVDHGNLLQSYVNGDPVFEAGSSEVEFRRTCEEW